MTGSFDKEAFVEELDTLEEDLNNLILDLINLAEISFEDEDEFEQAKKYLKYKLRQSILYLVVRMQRKRTFGKSIDPRDQ